MHSIVHFKCRKYYCFRCDISVGFRVNKYLLRNIQASYGSMGERLCSEIIPGSIPTRALKFINRNENETSFRQGM